MKRFVLLAAVVVLFVTALAPLGAAQEECDLKHWQSAFIPFMDFWVLYTGSSATLTEDVMLVIEMMHIKHEYMFADVPECMAALHEVTVACMSGMLGHLKSNLGAGKTDMPMTEVVGEFCGDVGKQFIAAGGAQEDFNTALAGIDFIDK